jgi:hypothetical protein
MVNFEGNMSDYWLYYLVLWFWLLKQMNFTIMEFKNCTAIYLHPFSSCDYRTYWQEKKVNFKIQLLVIRSINIHEYIQPHFILASLMAGSYNIHALLHWLFHRRFFILGANPVFITSVGFRTFCYLHCIICTMLKYFFNLIALLRKVLILHRNHGYRDPWQAGSHGKQHVTQSVTHSQYCTRGNERKVPKH